VIRPDNRVDALSYEAYWFGPGESIVAVKDGLLISVGPTGDRYSITEFPPGDGDPSLVDWSGDGSYALFAITKERKSYALSVDLHTGDRTTTPVRGTPEYTRPDGKALLVSTSFNGNEPGTLKRIDMSGHEQLAYPTDDLGGAGQFSGDSLESPDGTQLVLGTANLGNEVVPRSDNSLVVMDNNGSIIRTLPVPTQKAYCAPVKWWKPAVFLAHCSAERGSGEQLWEVPLDGGKPTALTAFNSAHGNDPGFEGNLGNWNAYQVPSGVFLPTAGACGTAFVSRLTPDGHTTRVEIPGVSDSVELAGVSGDKLVVVAMVGCGGGKSLLTYDPVANTSVVLLGPPINGGGVAGGRLYPDAK
jgi:TolB protein